MMKHKLGHYIQQTFKWNYTRWTNITPFSGKKKIHDVQAYVDCIVASPRAYQPTLYAILCISIQRYIQDGHEFDLTFFLQHQHSRLLKNCSALTNNYFIFHQPVTNVTNDPGSPTPTVGTASTNQ